MHNKVVLLTDKPKPLTAEGQFACVGISGSNKTIPGIQAEEIIGGLGLKIPPDHSVSSFAEYLFKKKKSDDDDVSDEDAEYEHKPYGLMFVNEGSSKFSEAKTKSYSAGTIELWSQIHDHRIAGSYYKTAEYGDPQAPYISIVINMAEYYVPKIPDDFWILGLCGRMLWRRIPFKKKKSASWLNRFHKEEAEKAYIKFKENLEESHDEIVKIDSDNPIELEVTEEADQLLMSFDNNALTRHYEAHMNDPYDKEHHFLTRLKELVGKTALRIAIGRHWGEHHSFEGFSKVTKEDVEQAIEIVNASCKDLEEIFQFINVFNMDLSKEEREIQIRVNKMKELLKKGYTLAQAKSRTNSYKANPEKSVAELVNKGHYKITDKGFYLDGKFYEKM